MASRWKSILVLVLAGVIGSPLRAEEEASRPFDCGPSALFVLVKLMDRDATYEAVLQALPPRHPDGYSMMELQTAASKLGLGLSGARLDHGDRLAGPAIAFVKSGREGHFVVLRPVGTTGRMVQVIDPPDAPEALDLDRLIDSPEWTGRLLIGESRTWRWVLWIGSICAGAVLARWAWMRRAPFSPNSSNAALNPAAVARARPAATPGRRGVRAGCRL